MSVTQYTIPCGYKIPRLKDAVYFVDKSTAKVVNIDNGTAYVTISNANPYKLQGFNIKITEEESIDERYLFVKTANLSINGHLVDASFLMDDEYFVIVEDFEGNFYLINVDFPSKMTYTYTLSDSQNQTDFTFATNSNFPLLKLNWNVTKPTNCKVYTHNGIKNLKLIEKGWTRVDGVNKVITLYDNHSFKDIDFNRGSCTLTEYYDGDKMTNTISFDIPFDNVQSSWQYNMLEFKQNLYVAEIFPKNSNNGFIVGFGNGFQPSYNAQGGTSNGDTSKYTITLTEMSQNGLEELVNWSVNQDTNKKWVYIKEIDGVWAATCVDFGVGRYNYMAEVDQDGNILGNFKRFSGASSDDFPYLNVIGTFNEEVTFDTPHCSCSNDYEYKFDNHFYCINGNKVQALESIHTYDCGKTGNINGTGSPISDYTKLGDVVETSSSFCNENVQYMWVLKTDKFECSGTIDRWVEVEYICHSYDKYLVEKQQIWDDNLGWIDTDPLVTRETLVAANSPDCGYFEGKYRLVYSTDDGEGYITAACDSTSSITSNEVSSYRGSTDKRIEIGSCVKTIASSCFYNFGFVKSVFIPNNVTSIGASAFEDCFMLASATIPDSVTTINDRVFYNCRGLTNITLPDGITSIGNAAFRECKSLTSLTIPNGVISIGNNTFYDCYNLTNITIPDSVTAIGGGAFEECNSFTHITIPNSITSISDWLFGYCENLSSVTLPNTITTIGGSAFQHCPSLTGLTIPDNVISIGSGAFKDCHNLTNITIPSGVTTINESTFENCYSITNVAIPDSVTVIGSKAFNYCSGLTSITIPDSVTAIGESAFCNTHITSVTIPSNVSSIGNYAFGSDNMYVTCLSTVPPTLGGRYALGNYANDIPIYVPAIAVDAYKSDTYWDYYGYADRVQPIL